MKDRMGAWATFFKVIGWICVIGGILSIFFLWGIAVVIIACGLVCWFSCAVLEWMDGLTDQLIGSREIQSKIAEELYLLRRQLSAQEEEVDLTEADVQETEPSAEEAEPPIAETGSRRRRPAHDQEE